MKSETMTVDHLCAEWDSDGICTSCTNRSFKNKDGRCEIVDPDCATYNSTTGVCFRCYSGFDLKDGKCRLK